MKERVCCIFKFLIFDRIYLSLSSLIPLLLAVSQQIPSSSQKSLPSIGTHARMRTLADYRHRPADSGKSTIHFSSSGQKFTRKKNKTKQNKTPGFLWVGERASLETIITKKFLVTDSRNRKQWGKGRGAWLGLFSGRNRRGQGQLRTE